MCPQGWARALWLTSLCMAFACARRDAPPSDSIAETSAAGPVAHATGSWVGELGSVLVVPHDSDNTGVVLFPAAPTPQSLAAMPLLLLTPAGDSSSVHAALVVSDSQVCGEAPTVRLTGKLPDGWSVGFMAAAMPPVRMDSIEALSSKDSVQLTLELARLASAIPSTTSSFAGLPFVVVSARRFETQGRRVIVATLLRRLPQEANPLEERTLLVAERPVDSSTAAYRASLHQRSEGSEDAVDHFEVLAALRGPATTFVVLARDKEAQATYEILELTRAGAWRSRWSRTLAC